MNNTLHIYSQGHPHGDAWILGDKESLRLLMNVIAKALESETVGDLDSYTADGEGFKTFVVVVKDKDLNGADLPYTSSYYSYSSSLLKSPYDIMENKFPGEYKLRFK